MTLACDVSRAFQKREGCDEAGVVPFAPHPSSRSIFPGRGADLVELPSHPSEPAAQAALTPETPGAPECFRVALSLDVGEATDR